MPKKTAPPEPKPPKPRKKRSTRVIPPTPSWTRPEVTIRRVMGRPPKLDRKLIAEFVEHIRAGLHLTQCSALCGVSPVMYLAWLKTGKDDDDAGRPTIHREFSRTVRAALAECQRRGVDTLVVYQRMAEGWDPYCATCKREQAPCGAHPKQLRLAADLQRWMLAHRFPKEWAPGAMPAVLAGDQDGAMVQSSSGEPVAAPSAYGAIVFLPVRRNEDDIT